MCKFISNLNLYQNIKKKKLYVVFHCTKLSHYFYILSIQEELREQLANDIDRKNTLEENAQPTQEEVKEIQKLDERIEAETKNSEDRYKMQQKVWCQYLVPQLVGLRPMY
jgi:Rps23 Pro-64 3,4-dihydroxylase Tpa1-like proline 4-hydroxylase